MLSSLKIKKSILTFFVLLAFVACSIFCFNPQITFANDEPQTYFYNSIEGLTIGDQRENNLTNLCWAFSTSKVVESLVLNQNEKIINISESWISLAYENYVSEHSTQLDKYDKQGYTYNNQGTVYLFEKVVNNYGIVEEKDCPLSISVNSGNSSTLFAQYKQKANTKIISNLKFKSIVVYGETDYNTLEEVLEYMKDYLVKAGALTTSVKYDVKTQGGDKYIYYDDTTDEPTHALTIIGYDDTKNFGDLDDDGEEDKGAFKALNSVGENQPETYIWLPYKLYTPNIVSGTETNLVLSGTYYISTMDIDTSEDNPTGGDTDPTGGGTDPTDGPQVKPSFWESFFEEDAIVKIGALAVGVIFLATAITLIALAVIRKNRTNAINKSVMLNSLANYQTHKVEIERQKQELEAQLEEIRYEAYRKQQRRLKRQFQKQLEESKNNNDENKT